MRQSHTVVRASSRHIWVSLAGMAIALALIVGLLPGSAAAQQQELFWERYDTTIDLREDGSFTVTEDQLINFTSGSFSEGFAVIPLDRIEDISNIQVSEDGQQYERGSGSPGTFQITDYGDEIEILWWFDEASNETRQFTIQYDVTGGLRVYEETGREQLWWRAIDTDFAADVRQSMVTMNLPAPVTEEELAAEIFTIDTEDTSIEMPDADTIVFTASNLGQGDAFEARAEFPDMTAAAVPSWQAASDAAAEREDRLRPLKAIANLGFLGLGLLMLVGGPIAIYSVWQSRGKDPQVELPIDILREPPDDLLPGAVGVLVDERADDHDVIATIVDLGERGVVHIEESSSNLMGITFNRDWTLRKTGTTDGLTKYEKETLDAIFGGKSEVELTKIRERFSARQAKVKEAMYDQLVEHDYFPRNPETTRRQWRVGGYILLGLTAAFGFLFAGIISGFAPLVWVPVFAAGILGLILIATASHMSRKTQQGAEAAAKWNAFRRYLVEIERYQDVNDAKAIFSSYLPYAVAFGLERTWVRKFSQIDTPAPHWYGPYHGGPMRRPYHRRGGMVIIPGAGGGSTSGEGGGFDTPSMQGMSDSFGGSLQGMSDGMFSMFNEASKVFKPFSSNTGGTGSRGSFGGGGFSGGGGSFGGGGGGGSRGFR
ncbi:MAG: DUF2207 domain-containing protein [Chloroflexia bacterium]|nr:DUF2207 domain-containing protein [Chloroflexia bacterium]